MEARRLPPSVLAQSERAHRRRMTALCKAWGVGPREATARLVEQELAHRRAARGRSSAIVFLTRAEWRVLSDMVVGPRGPRDTNLAIKSLIRAAGRQRSDGR